MTTLAAPTAPRMGDVPRFLYLTDHVCKQSSELKNPKCLDPVSVEFVVRGVHAHALVDSGASCSLVSLETLQRTD